MIDYNIKKITGDLGNFIKIDEYIWADENGYLINLESTCFDNREFKWMAKPGAHYISILKIFDSSNPTKELELCLIKQEKRYASKLWFIKHSGRPWEYQAHDIVDIAGFGSNYKSNNYKNSLMCYSEKRLILTEITKEMFETLLEQLKKTRKFGFEIKE